MTRGSDPDGMDEETKSDDPMVDQGTRLSETGRDRDQDRQEANRQISELRAMLAAQDEKERLRHEEYRALSDRFYKEFCRYTESPVEGYLRLKQEFRETPRTFPWRLNVAATKANVDYHSASGCRRHVNQFLKNLRDRDLQLSLQGRVNFTTDELEDVLKQVVEMEQGMRRKPSNDVQFGCHKPQGTGPGAPARGGSGAYAAVAAPEIPEPQVPDPGDLRWEDEDASGNGYQYDEENDEAYDGLVDQEEVFRAEVPGSWNDSNGRPQDRPDSRACCQLHPAGECAVIKAFKDAAQRGQLQGLPEEVLQRLCPEATPALNN
ncbi:hypothetical protein PHMEG_00024219 [Phytophthora megakarya]|uniref:Uncharacterized protein n=1 Tax=Phytophthora megakarya TaxID=4795 RepID=A0A225VFQ6_9STRA|nr:hypothetical protein PHMEG_00024219 [Phytophthora megakarya]